MDKVGKPGIPIVSGAALCSTSLATDPDRDTRVGLGVEGEIVKSVVLRVMINVRLLGIGELSDDLELLIGNAATVFEGYSKGGEFFLHPANADAHDEATPREAVNGGGNSGPVEGMPVGENENTDTQSDLFGAASQEG